MKAMWRWKPAWFRRLAMVPIVPLQILFGCVLMPLLVFTIEALVCGLSEVRDLNWSMAWRWCRDTWRGQPFRPYD